MLIAFGLDWVIRSSMLASWLLVQSRSSIGAVCSLLSRLVVSLPKESLVYYSSFHLSEILTCGLSSFKQVPQFPRIRTQFPFSIFWLSGLGCFLAVDFRRTVKRDSSFDTHPFFWHTFRTTMVVKNVLYIYGEILHPCRAFRIVNILFERTNFLVGILLQCEVSQNQNIPIYFTIWSVKWCILHFNGLLISRSFQNYYNE